MLEKLALILKALPHLINFSLTVLSRSTKSFTTRIHHKLSPQPASNQPSEKRNIVVIGASFAGFFAARWIASQLPPNSPYTVAVIEPHSHFHFTWALPRFCVVEGHEEKAFIPYTPLIKSMPKGTLRWIKNRVDQISKEFVKLQGGEEIRYEYLVVATGSGASFGLPSRLMADNKVDAVEEVKNIQRRIKESNKIVVVGGGAAGVELAADAKALYPNKVVTLIHSRHAVMHRFGIELQEEALGGLQKLGVEVILNERVMNEDQEAGVVTLKSGRTVSCDYFINCTGQRPSSNLISQLSPSSIADNGYVKVKPTMQIADDTFPRIYACGDVTDMDISNPNARAAISQALTVSDNILSAIKGQIPRHVYSPHWVDESIKLTLGLDETAIYISDKKASLLLSIRKQHIDLDSREAWRHFSAKPFQDLDDIDHVIMEEYSH